jgi:uncharacterized protein with FMN-binding domain
MKNLRKSVYAAMALVLVFVAGGCGTGSNVPGIMTGNTGNSVIGKGTAIVPGTSAITGTNNAVIDRRNPAANTGTYPGMNLGVNNRTNTGTNLGANLRKNLGMNPGMNNLTYPGAKTGTNLSANPGTGFVPKVTGTAGNKAYKDGIYTASGNTVNGANKATVTISRGKIEKVVLRSYNKAGKEVNYNTISGKRTGGKTLPNLNSIRDNIQRQVISKQNANVVMGKSNAAKTTTDSWISDIRKALDQAKI